MRRPSRHSVAGRDPLERRVATVARLVGYLLGCVAGSAIGTTASSQPMSVATADRPIHVAAGERVDAALDRLAAAGLKLLYSTALVDPGLRVRRAVSGDDPEAVARELLRPLGLVLRSLGPDLYGVAETPRGLRWRLAGRVVDAADGRPLPQTRVEVLADRFVTWSAMDGAFSLDLVGRQPTVVRLSAEGFAEARQAIAFPEAADTPMEIRLVRLPQALEQITVVASRFTYEDPPRSGAFLLDQSAVIGQPKIGEDALQALARLPGVSFSGLSARPNVRGGESGEMRVVLDGMPIRQPFHLPAYNAAFSVVDEALVRGIDVYTGTLPVRFGNRLSAVAELHSLAGGEPPGQALGLSTWNARLRGGLARDAPLPIEGLVSARVGTVKHWIQRYARDVGRPSFEDAFARASTSLPGGVEIGLRGLAATSRLEQVDVDTGEQAELASRSSYLWLDLARRDPQGLSLYGTVGVSNLDSDRLGSAASELTASGSVEDRRRSRLWDLAVRAVWAPQPADQSLEFGVTVADGEARYDYRSEAQFESLASALFGVAGSRRREARLDVLQTSWGAFVNLRRRLHDRWFVEIGGRLDREAHEGARLESTQWSPRAALRWDPDPRTTWRASLGRSFQRDEVHELRVEDGVVAFAPPQRADQAVLGFERRLLDGLTLRVEAYERRITAPRLRFENLFHPIRYFPELAADRVVVAPRRSQLRGVELSAQWERGAWSLWGAYTLSSAVDELADGRRVARDWDQRHGLVAVANWRSRDWNVSALGALHSGRPTTPVLRTALDDPQLAARNSGQLGSFANLDLRVAREFPLRRGRLVAYAQVTNVFNRRNPCCFELDLPDDSTARQLDADPLHAYPAVPAIGIQWDY